MNDSMIDRMALIVAGRTDRRGAVRTLGAVLVSGAGVVALRDGADAHRRKQRREDRCHKGKLVQRVEVPANGDDVQSKPLAKGQRYTLRVSGYLTDDEWGLDGEYYFLLADPTNRAEVYDACLDSTPVGVEVSGAAFSGWGPYTDDHAYEATVTGKGNPLTLRLGDCYYPGNTGTLRVEVICG